MGNPRDALSLQREYNRQLSAHAEVITLAPKCSWSTTGPLTEPRWWQFDRRIRSWMGMWDARFAARYQR